MAKRLGGYMSWVAECLFFPEVSKCLGDIMSGWQNVSATQCPGGKMSGSSQNVAISEDHGMSGKKSMILFKNTVYSQV